MIEDELFYRGSDVIRMKYYKLHMVLLDSDEYSNLTNDARILYAVLYKRLQLSMFNGWVDDSNRTYFYYTREELAAKLRVSEKTGRKAVKQLIDSELLFESRQGRGLPNKLYLLKPKVTEPETDLSKGDYSGNDPRPQTGKKYRSRVANFTVQDWENLPGNNKDKNNIELVINPPFIPPAGETVEDVRGRIDYQSFSGDDLRIVDEIVNVLLDIQRHRRKTFRIGTYYRDTQKVKELFAKVDRDAVAHVIQAVSETEKIDNFHSYAISVLYNYLTSPAAGRKPKQRTPRIGFLDCQQRDGKQFDDALRELGLS